MVITRRSRALHPQEGSEQVGGSAEEPLLTRQQQRPPPPPPPPPLAQNENVRTLGTRATDNNSGDNAVNQNVLQSPTMMGSNQNQNSNNNDVDIQYLQVRVPPPTRALNFRRPFHIHRRKRYSAPNDPATKQQPRLNDRIDNDNQTGGKQIATNSRYTSKRPPSFAAYDGDIVRILIPPNGGFASERQLAECLSQAGETNNDHHGTRGIDFDEYNNYDDDASWDSMDEYYDYNDSKQEQPQSVNVAGMFRESDRVFIPLSVIYSNPISFVGDVLSLKSPPPPMKLRPMSSKTPNDVKPKQRSIFAQFLEIVGIIAVTIVSWWSYSAAGRVDWGEFYEATITKFEVFVWNVISLPFWLFDVLVEFPLRELYRYGPSVVGWEGEPLPRICAQITYTGDEGFWSRNIEECERIYKAKEDAAMLFRKPLLVSVIVVTVFYMIKSIVEARALRRRERIDPNMVETFRAMNMLCRQLRRAMNTR